MVWGRDEASAKAALADAHEAGDIRSDEIAVCGVWPYSDPMPAPRWINKDDRIRGQEQDALIEAIQKRVALKAGPTAESAEPTGRIRRVQEMTDAELYVAALGSPVSRTAA